MSVETIVNSIKPDQDEIDRRLIYELAGIRLNESDNDFDSSFEEDNDADRYDGNGLGYGNLSLINEDVNQRTKLLS